MADRQHVMTDGLVVRDYRTVAETDRFVAILTRDKGIIRANARGARNVKSRSGAATQMLCYASLSLIPGKDKYIVEDAQPKEVFFALREDVTRLALAQYFCELALQLCPTDSPAPDHLRLLLNALHYLCTGDRDPRLIKGVVEARLLCLEGYMPELTGCCRCHRPQGERFWFSPQGGTITCDGCTREPDSLPLSPGVLAALRHVMMGDFSRCFAFTLSPADTVTFSQLTERFLLAQVQRSFKTLEFYHTLDM